MQRSYLGTVRKHSRPPEVVKLENSRHDAITSAVNGSGLPLTRPSIDARSLASLWAPRASRDGLNAVSSHPPSSSSYSVDLLVQSLSRNLVQSKHTVDSQALLHSQQSQMPKLSTALPVVPNSARYSQGTQDIIQQILSNPPPDPPRIRKRRYKKRVSAGPPRSNSRGDLDMIEEDTEVVTWANALNHHIPPYPSYASSKYGRAKPQANILAPKSAPKSTIPRQNENVSRAKSEGLKSVPKDLERAMNSQQRRSRGAKASSSSSIKLVSGSVSTQKPQVAEECDARHNLRSLSLPFKLLTQENLAYNNVRKTAGQAFTSQLFDLPKPQVPSVVPGGSYSPHVTSNTLASGQPSRSRALLHPANDTFSRSSASLLTEVSTTSSASTSSSVIGARKSKKLAEFEVMQFQAAVLTSCATRSLGPSLDDEWREKKNKMERMAKYAQVVRARMIQQQKIKAKS